MSKKITATRCAAFLKALAETGNQTLAAERAKVSRSWVVLHRGRDAAFDQSPAPSAIGDGALDMTTFRTGELAAHAAPPPARERNDWPPRV